jgi:hypothetical protein
MKKKKLIEALDKQSAILVKIEKRLEHIDEKLAISLCHIESRYGLPNFNNLKTNWERVLDVIESYRQVHSSVGSSKWEIEKISRSVDEDIELRNKFWGTQTTEENPYKNRRIQF